MDKTSYYEHGFTGKEQRDSSGRLTSFEEGGSSFSGLEGNNEGVHAIVKGARYDYLPPMPDEHGQYKLFDYTAPQLTTLASSKKSSPATVANVLAMIKTKHPDIEPPHPVNINPMSSEIIKTAASRGFIDIPDKYPDYFGQAKEKWDSDMQLATRGPFGIKRSVQKVHDKNIAYAKRWGQRVVRGAYKDRERYEKLSALGVPINNVEFSADDVRKSRQRIIQSVASKRDELSNAQGEAFAEYDRRKEATQGDTNLFGEPLNPRNRM